MESLYAETCDCCGGIVDLADQENFSTIYDEIARQLIADGSADFNPELYFKTAQNLMGAVGNGLGGASFEQDDDRAVLASALRNNIYAFSAAKSFVQMKHFRDLMIDKDGKIKSDSAIRKAIADEGTVFNDRYLQAEIHVAKYSAIMAHKWDTLDAEYLEYSTVGDNRVRLTHKMLDRFTALKSDPVWNKIYPIKDFGCRCTVIPGKAQNVAKNRMSNLDAEKMMSAETKGTMFDNHVGKTRVIFTDKHPYFIDAAGKQKQLSWEQYGLKPLEKIRVNPLPEYKEMSQSEFYDWWQKQPKFKGDDIVVKDVLGDPIILASGDGKKGNPDKYFKQHILKKSNENRFYAAEANNVLRSADEVWYTPEQGRVYLKYYEHGTLKLVANDQLEALTLFKLYDKDSGELKKSRKGLLLYRK